MAKKWISGLMVLFSLSLLGHGSRGQSPGKATFEDIPMSGIAGPGLTPIDNAVKRIMDRHGIPGAAVALAQDGRLVYARGFGHANLATGDPVMPDTLFGLASGSKPITALAILKLLEEGKLKLEDLVFDLLRHLVPPKGASVDSRLAKITIHHLLNHSGGWNRQASGDPITWSPQIARRLGVKQPLTAEQFASFMMSVPLDFEPGTRNEYSNVGYILLGLVIEKASGQDYETYVRKAVLEPMGMKATGINSVNKYLPGEARRYLAGTGQELPPLQLPMLKAAGGWSASVLDMMRFMTALDGSRGKAFLNEKTMKVFLAPPQPPLQIKDNGTFYGLGWETMYVGRDGFGYFQDGNWNGMRTFMKRTQKGINYILAFNAHLQPDLIDNKITATAIQEIRTTMERVDFPKVDLFKNFK